MGCWGMEFFLPVTAEDDGARLWAVQWESDGEGGQGR